MQPRHQQQEFLCADIQLCFATVFNRAQIECAGVSPAEQLPAKSTSDEGAM